MQRLCSACLCFFFNDTATTEIYTFSLHDALPIWLLGDGHGQVALRHRHRRHAHVAAHDDDAGALVDDDARALIGRSEEHTSELQSRQYLVCRLLLEKKTKNNARTARVVETPVHNI